MKLAFAFVILGISTFSGCSSSSSPATNPPIGVVHSSGRIPVVLTDTDEPIPPEVDRALRDVGQQQSKGLLNATTTVHGAYDYNGFSNVQPIQTAKLISVDVEFTGFAPAFDLDDVDIVDSETGKNYGSDPDIYLLGKDGKVRPNSSEKDWPSSPGPLRVLLIYPVPKTSTPIRLSYWGQDIKNSTSKLHLGGPAVPMPAK